MLGSIGHFWYKTGVAFSAHMNPGKENESFYFCLAGSIAGVSFFPDYFV